MAAEVHHSSSFLLGISSRYILRQNSEDFSDSIGDYVKESLASLMSTIEKTTPHYVRCIKPNPQKKPSMFVKPQVLHQLRCGGVLESVHVHLVVLKWSSYPECSLEANRSGSAWLVIQDATATISSTSAIKC